MEVPLQSIDARYQQQLAARQQYYDKLAHDKHSIPTASKSKRSKAEDPFLAHAQIEAAKHAAASGDVQRAIEVMGTPEQYPNTKDDPNWSVIKLCFLASSCTYLRNADKLAAAAAAMAAAELRSASDAAIALLKESHASVDKVCEILGLSFVTICDMVEDISSPRNWDGPYGAAFFRMDENPFIIVSFRGTASFLEWIRDFDFKPVDSQTVDVLWQSNIHKGFFDGMFGQFGASGRPFDMIQTALEELAIPLRHHAKTNRPIPVYFAGHSLGGAYATLAFSEHLHILAPHSPLSAPTNVPVAYDNVGLYTYGGPRVGLRNFAEPTMNAINAPGSQYQVWRIVNAHDPVAFVPAWWYPRGLLHPRYKVGFFHLNKGVHLVDGKWELMASELAGEEEPEREREARKLEVYCSAYPPGWSGRRASIGSPTRTSERARISVREGSKLSEIQSVQDAGAELPKLDAATEKRAWDEVRRDMNAEESGSEAEGKAVTLGIPNVFNHTRKSYWKALKDLGEDLN